MCCAVLGAFSVFRSRFFCPCCRREAIVEICTIAMTKKSSTQAGARFARIEDLSIVSI